MIAGLKVLHHTDEKDASYLLRWLSGAQLSDKQQLDLDVFFIDNCEKQDILDVISCFNSERVATFGDLKRISLLFETENYLEKLETNKKVAQTFGFFQSKLLHQLLLDIRKKDFKKLYGVAL